MSQKMKVTARSVVLWADIDDEIKEDTLKYGDTVTILNPLSVYSGKPIQREYVHVMSESGKEGYIIKEALMSTSRRKNGIK